MGRNEKQLAAAKALVEDLAKRLDVNMWVRLWDGSRVPLGKSVSSDYEIAVTDPGAIGAVLRHPSLDAIIHQYVDGGLDFRGGTLIDIGRQFQDGHKSFRLKSRDLPALGLKLAPFLFEKSRPSAEEQGFAGEITGQRRKTEDNKAYIQFHYDLSNDFYALFLDQEMVYSCAYYTDWANGIDQAQHDKLEMICRKLRLKAGETFLDIGSGWGGLVCHAAQNYGVRAHGITLSEQQLQYAREKVKRLGLEDRVTLSMTDYSKMTGSFDKIASIGMYEHIGLKNIPAYMSKVRSLLTEEGLFLNHAISRRAPRPARGWIPARMRPEKKAIAKYIFPGGELDDVGHSVSALERAGFEVHDVEGWRLHYARTCQLWCDRLTANKEQAVAHVGEEKYRIWVAYLAGVSLAFSRGTLRLYQTLASRAPRRTPVLPPTRADLYR